MNRGKARGASRRLRLVLPLLLLAPPVPVAPALTDQIQDPEWWWSTLEDGGALVESMLPPELAQALAVPTRADWDAFWSAVVSAMQADDLSALAALDPYVHEALGLLDAVPTLAPYGDWLRQRLDYFDVAADVVRSPAPSLPSPVPPVRPPSTQTPRWPRIPPPQPKAPRATVPEQARTVAYWTPRLAKRQVPAARTAVIPRLKAIFREEGVPESLVWMAETESTLNPLARSPAGAAGLFQFMPATAGRFGLRLQPTDERLEPEKSARAAARYLKLLNGRFRDWPLALAAYNAGEGRVGRALSGAGGRTFEAVADQLPAETQMYVPKVLATIALREGRPFDPGRG